MGEGVFDRWAKKTERFRKGLADAKKPKPGMTLEQKRAEADKKPKTKLQSDGVYR